MRAGTESIERIGLNVQLAQEDRALQLKLRTSSTVDVKVFANDKMMGAVLVNESNVFSSSEIPLDTITNNIHNLRVTFEGQLGSFIEIDSIQVIRDTADAH